MRMSGTPRSQPPRKRAREERVANASLPTSKNGDAEPTGEPLARRSAEPGKSLSPDLPARVRKLQKTPSAARPLTYRCALLTVRYASCRDANAILPPGPA